MICFALEKKTFKKDLYTIKLLGIFRYKGNLCQKQFKPNQNVKERKIKPVQH